MSGENTAADDWKEIVASSLGWEEAHKTVENALEGLPAELRGTRPAGMPYSPWEILEHIRITQWDLLEFCRNPDYEEELTWPDDYWPKAPAPPGEEAWKASVAAVIRDREELMRFTTQPGRDLTATIPAGTGQTYLRTVLVALDHTAYHAGSLVVIRRLLGSWPPTEQP